MTNTEIALVAAYRSPIVPLADICDSYLSLNPKTAYARAATNSLPVPTFRLGSRKAPLMVHVADLAKHIDAKASSAAAEWKHSQV